MSSSVVQESVSNAWSSASVTTATTVAFTANAAVGNTIEVCILWNNGAGTLPSSVVDSAGQTYAHQGTTGNDNNSGLFMAVYTFANNQSTTKLTVTATWAAAVTYAAIRHKEITGVGTIQLVKVNNQPTGSPGTGAGAITSGLSGTLSQSPVLLSGSSFDDGGGASSVAVSPFAGGGTDWVLTGSGNAASLTSAWVRQTSTTSVAFTLTNTTDGASRSFITIMVVYNESAGAGAALAATPSTTTAATGTLGLKHVVADLVFETTATTGTGALTLAGAVTGYRAFSSVMSDQDTCLYLAQAVTGGVPNGPWEIGIGTYNASGNTLSRTQVLKSSNSNALVSFAAGTTNVALTEPAEVLWNKGVHNVGNSGSAITIDWANGPYQMVTLNAATPTITLANSMLCPHGILEIYQDATGGRVPTITGAVYRSGSAPTWSTTNATHDTLDIDFNVVTGKSNVFLKT